MSAYVDLAHTGAAYSAIAQGVPLAVVHSPGAIGNVGGLLESISMIAHRASENKIDNIMVVRELIMESPFRFSNYNK